MSFNLLKKKIKNKKAVIAVIGVGYVGSSLIEAVSKSGLNVIGYDNDILKINRLKNKKNKNVFYTYSINDVRRSDIVVIALPTPVKDFVHPDLSYLEDALNDLLNFVLREDQLLILESTVQPGTTRKLLWKRINERLKILKPGKNFFLGYSPERVDPGSAQYSDIRKIPKIVSGMTTKCKILTKLFYDQFIENTYQTSSIEIAELAKLYENTFRAINIAFVQEITRIVNRLGMDMVEVLEAAYTKPFGIMPFWPSVGVGGHCIPVDLLYLDSWARTNDCYSQFVELAHRINQGMPYYVLEKISKILNDSGKSLKGSSVLMIGVTYKPDVADLRSSSALKLSELLAFAGVNIQVYDPFLSTGEIKIDKKFKIVRNLNRSILLKQDLVVLAVHHKKNNYKLLKKSKVRLFDCGGKPLNEIRNKSLIKM